MFTVSSFHRSRFDDLFGEFERMTRMTHAAQVPASVWSNDEAVAVTLELPGVTKEHLQIEATADTVTVSGERRVPEVSGTWIIRDRTAGRFSRTITLPWRIDPERVEARLTDGVLTIALRRAESDKPRKITVAA
jgi:HSP20 family protein